jgi:hypothetical protein
VTDTALQALWNRVGELAGHPCDRNLARCVARFLFAHCVDTDKREMSNRATAAAAWCTVTALKFFEAPRPFAERFDGACVPDVVGALLSARNSGLSVFDAVGQLRAGLSACAIPTGCTQFGEVCAPSLSIGIPLHRSVSRSQLFDANSDMTEPTVYRLQT